jgi:hypothetical protein
VSEIVISQRPATVNLYMTKGDDFAVPVVFTGANVSARTFAAFVFEDLSDVPLFSAAVQYVSAATGSMKVVFASTDTAALSPTGSYRWCLRETTGGLLITKLSGRFNARLP